MCQGSANSNVLRCNPYNCLSVVSAAMLKLSKVQNILDKACLVGIGLTHML